MQTAIESIHCSPFSAEREISFPFRRSFSIDFSSPRNPPFPLFPRSLSTILIQNLSHQSLFESQHTLHTYVWLQRREQCKPTALSFTIREFLRIIKQLLSFHTETKRNKKEKSLFEQQQDEKKRKKETSRRILVVASICVAWREAVRGCAEHHPDCLKLSAADVSLLREVLKALRQDENTLFGFERELLIVGTRESVKCRKR